MNRAAANLLRPFSALFGAAVAARGKLYENAVFKQKKLSAPVVSVGNLTVGGTGKTPLVRFVCEILHEQNHRVCVLTRGYKRRNPNERVLVSDAAQILANAETAGDEPFELAEKLLNVAAVVADKNRFAAGVWAKENLGATAFVLDDGFQHRQLKRDLDIVAIDATDPFGNNKLLPAGTLREPLTSLKRADCIIITRANLEKHFRLQIADLKAEISEHNQQCPILLSKTEIVGLHELTEFHQSPKIKNQRSSPALAFCALGNPENFYESLRLENFHIAAARSFADHHVYTEKDVALIESAARENNAEILLTTWKDAVKLRGLIFNLPCFVIEIETAFDDDAPLRDLLRNTACR